MTDNPTLTRLTEAALEGINSVHDIDVTLDDYARAAAEAMLAALPECVTPLVWVEERGLDYVIFRAGSTLTTDLYSCGTDADGDSYWCLNSGPFFELDSGGYKAAKAAADAHHVAQVMAALGVTAQEPKGGE